MFLETYKGILVDHHICLGEKMTCSFLSIPSIAVAAVSLGPLAMLSLVKNKYKNK